MAWITTMLLVSNASVAFGEPIMFIGLLMLSRVRAAFNADGAEDIDARKASDRRAASAECRVLEEDRKILMKRLRNDGSCEAIVTAARGAAIGADACLAVQQLLYQSSRPADSEILALTVVTEDASIGQICSSTGCEQQTEQIHGEGSIEPSPATLASFSLYDAFCATDLGGEMNEPIAASPQHSAFLEELNA